MTDPTTKFKTHRDLFVLADDTDGIKIWKIAEHQHAVIGERRGFQVRTYHDAEWPEPYFVAIIAMNTGHVMDGSTVPTEAAAQAEAFDMLVSLDSGVSAIARA